MTGGTFSYSWTRHCQVHTNTSRNQTTGIVEYARSLGKAILWRNTKSVSIILLNVRNVVWIDSKKFLSGIIKMVYSS